MTEFRGSDAYIAKVDYSNPNLIYVGEAVPGTNPSDQLWRIRQVSVNAILQSVSVFWANGTNSFDKIWNNRVMYTYE